MFSANVYPQVLLQTFSLPSIWISSKYTKKTFRRQLNQIKEADLIPFALGAEDIRILLNETNNMKYFLFVQNNSFNFKNSKFLQINNSIQPNISNVSFFQNKYGFSEKFLNSTSNLLQPQKYLFSNISQHRTFKTRNVDPFAKNKRSDSLLVDFKNAFEKITNKETMQESNEALKTLLSKNGDGEKLKVAFAEGYLANKGGKGDGGSTTAGLWKKRLSRMFWVGFFLWIFIQFFQIYTPLGGNVKIMVTKGDRFEINPEEINVSFDDVKGMDEVKQELKDIVEYLKDPERFKVLGARLPKGVLLVGPPGIGKSLLARAVAGESGVPFFQASGSEFDEIFVGTGAKRVRQLFDSAKARAPCIVFIDEIDSVGAKRTSSQIHPYANQTINQLLSEMDGFMQNEGVIVMGATNRRDNLDKALLRPGRFDIEIRVFPPDYKGRMEIFDHYLKRIKKAGELDISKLARGTTGCSGADLENIVNQAALKAAIDGDLSVTMAHLDYARDKVLMGPAKKTRLADENTNQMTAYHEAGHTIVAYFTKLANPINKVTIIQRGNSLGHTSFVPDKDQYNLSKAQLLAQLDVAMGGRVAEELIYGADNVTTGAQADFSSATMIATAMVKQYGMSEKVGVRVFHDDEVDTGISFVKLNEMSPTTTELVDNEIKRLLQESYDRAKILLKQHASEHRNLSLALLKYEILNAEEVKDIIEGRDISPRPPPNSSVPPTTKIPSVPAVQINVSI